jgi:hypothetical protein
MDKKGSVKTPEGTGTYCTFMVSARNAFVAYRGTSAQESIMSQTDGSVYGKNKQYNSLFLSFVDCTLKYLQRSTWISWKMMPMGFLRYQDLYVGYLLHKKCCSKFSRAFEIRI